MDWTALWAGVKEVGFPIVITIYILARLEGACKDLTEKVIQLDSYVRAKLGDK